MSESSSDSYVCKRARSGGQLMRRAIINLWSRGWRGICTTAAIVPAILLCAATLRAQTAPESVGGEANRSGRICRRLRFSGSTATGCCSLGFRPVFGRHSA